ncbi:hypothetical protein BGZ80_006329, partial [Entomortierella chlamydospora]
MGVFINVLPLRIDVGDRSVHDSVLQTHADLETLLGHERASLALAQRCSGVPAGTPLFSAILNYRHNSTPSDESQGHIDINILEVKERTNYPFVIIQLPGVTLKPEDMNNDIVKFDLDLALWESSGEIVGGLSYSTALFDHSTIERHVGYLQTMLQVMVNNASQSIGAVDILSSSERELLLQTWNATSMPYPDHLCIHQIFENQVEQSSDAIALVYEDQSLTYTELNTRANRLALQLRKSGIKHGDFIATLLKRSFELITAQIAILKVGAIYVPIDPKAPEDRQAFIINDCSAKLLITDEHTQVSSIFQVPLLRLDVNCLSEMEVTDTTTSDGITQGVTCQTSSCLDTAYAMYTSGSTGLPKGVLVPHRAIARLAINNGYANIGAHDRVAFAANPAFDASTFEIWAPLLNGGRVVIIDADTFTDCYRLREALDHHQITTLFLTTVLFNQFVTSIGPALAKLRYLLCGGEQENLESFSTLMKHGGPENLIHCYGPTETTTFATTYKVAKIADQQDRLPIGRPISNTTIYVLDQHRRPVPLGCEGELYIGGTGVANGYLNRSILTGERFIPDPFSKQADARMYRTGDLVRYLDDGNLVFVSRNDDQVKIRGFRIELGEIEARLLEHPLVREAVVIAVGTDSDKRLVAYVVTDTADHLPQLMRDHLATVLPEYMIPAAFVQMDALPLTPNGKLDKRALPEPERDAFASQGYEAPQGEIETSLATIWADLLKIERVSRHDDFFMLGGHSLLAVRLMNRISTLGVNLQLFTLFASPTLSELANVISSKFVEENNTVEAIAPISRDEVLPLSFAQQRLWFLAQMEGVSDAYHIAIAIRLEGSLNRDAWQSALNTIFARHESLRSTFVNIE